MSAVRGTAGSSLVELIISLTILSIGVLGLVGTGVAVNRLLGQGRWATVAALAAERRLEMLKATAVDSTTCAGLTGGSALLPGGLNEQWSITRGLSTQALQVVVTGGARRADTLSTILRCP